MACSNECPDVTGSKCVRMCVWVGGGQREGELSDAGSCAAGVLGCRSSGTGDGEPSPAGQRTEGQRETQRATTSWRNLTLLIMCPHRTENLQSW